MTKNLNLNDLVILYLEGAGFNTDKWRHTEFLHIDPRTNEYFVEHIYVVIPRICSLYIFSVEEARILKEYNSIVTEMCKISDIKVDDINFQVRVSASDPDSFEQIKKTLFDLYIWMKNINPECIEGMLDESKEFNSRTNIGSRR